MFYKVSFGIVFCLQLIIVKFQVKANLSYYVCIDFLNFWTSRIKREHLSSISIMCGFVRIQSESEILIDESTSFSRWCKKNITLLLM